MKLSAEKYTIRLPRPFRIAHGASTSRETILVHLHDEETGLTGHGEGALPPYYPSTAEASLRWLGNPEDPAPPEAAAAVAALEIARQDLAAQRNGCPLHALFPPHASPPPCARTLSIPENSEELKELLAEGLARGSRHFKLKLGSGDAAWDEECFRVARETLPEAVFSIDANGAWTPRQAARLIPRLAVQGADFIEQPVAREWEAWRELRSISRIDLPLVADESVQSRGDIAVAEEVADGINIKLLKAGGLVPAYQWTQEARRRSLRVMIGVMVETGIGRTAAAQLAHLADWLDIDPPDAIPAAPWSGFDVQGDRLIRSGAPGLGLASA